jgi:N6-adenosine-specific RNA methylase IME4
MLNKGLVIYERARDALAEARRIDEVMDIRNKADALRAYAKQSKDGELIRHATEIKLRATRRMGEMLKQMRERGELAKQGRPPDKAREGLAFLADFGISDLESAAAGKLSALAQDEFERRVASATDRAMKDIEMTKEERHAEKKARRAQHEEELASKILALPSKRYGVIYADPPWQFNPWSDEGADRNASNHYAVQMLDQIKGREIGSIAADDCALFLWATAPMLPQALEVMNAWGFEYRTHCVWLKDKTGTGYWFRNAHELLLLGVRGEVPGPAPGTQWESAWEDDVGQHSAKPEAGYKLIERYFQRLPKIELYATHRREGWDAWGANAPSDLEAVE